MKQKEQTKVRACELDDALGCYPSSEDLKRGGLQLVVGNNFA